MTLFITKLEDPAFVITGVSWGLPFLLVTYLLWRFGVDAPIFDEWSLVEDLRKLHAGEWTLADLWRSHNGHRILIPRIILVPLAALTGWHIRMALVLNLVVGLATFFSLALAAAVPAETSRARRSLGFLLTGLVVFSLAQWENWQWSLQVHVFLALLFTVAYCNVLVGSQEPTANLSWKRLALAAFLVQAASLCQSAGIVLWPLGVGLILLRRRAISSWKAKLMVWTLMGGCATLLYAIRAPGDSSSMAEPGYVLTHPTEAVVFALTMIGSPVVSFSGSAWPPQPSVLAPMVGFAGICVLAWNVRRHLKPWFSIPSRRFALLFQLSATSLAMAALVALARSHSGPAAAMASRYTTLMVPFWVAVGMLLIDGGWSARRSAAGLSSRMGLLTILAGVLTSSIYSLGYFPERFHYLFPARQALAEGGPVELLSRLHTEVHQVTDNMATLRELRLSVFRDQGPVRPVKELSEYRQDIRLLGPTPELLMAGEIVVLPVSLTNPGGETWPSTSRSAEPVNLTYRWLEAGDGSVVVADGHRVSLPEPLAGGDSVELDLKVETPDAVGEHILRLSAVQEGVAWFTDRGAEPLDIVVQIERRSLR